MRGGIHRSLGFRPRIFFLKFFLVRKFLCFFGVAEKEAEGGRERRKKPGKEGGGTRRNSKSNGSAQLDQAPGFRATQLEISVNDMWVSYDKRCCRACGGRPLAPDWLQHRGFGSGFVLLTASLAV
jgi:hypothetical protein